MITRMDITEDIMGIMNKIFMELCFVYGIMVERGRRIKVLVSSRNLLKNIGT